MIPSWSLKFIPHLIAGLAVLGVMAWGYGAIKEQGRNELRPTVERLQAELNSERAARQRNEEAIDAYLSEIESIRNRPRPTTPVRLCVTPSVPVAAPAAGSSDGAAAPAERNTSEAGGDLVAGPDIGPALRDLAFSCDAENAKLRALQGWIRGLE